MLAVIAPLFVGAASGPRRETAAGGPAGHGSVEAAEGVVVGFGVVFWMLMAVLVLAAVAGSFAV